MLVVEDDADVRSALALLLQASGYATETAEDGHDAMNRLRAGLRPSVILLDLALPTKSGWHFRTEQRAFPELAAIPVIGCSGDPYLTEKAFALQLAGSVAKPIDEGQLLAAVAQVIGAKAGSAA